MLSRSLFNMLSSLCAVPKGKVPSNRPRLNVTDTSSIFYYFL